MIKKAAFIVFALFLSHQLWSQDADTLKRELDEVVITGYLSRQPIAQVPASVAVLNSKVLWNGSQQSLLPALNTVPGVRMEERSPGSYRLSIRGSLLRSPFGVRNVKMYLNDLPFTDASGNTYLNLIDPALLQRVEILKGPDGSLFGANSGGVVLLDSDHADSASVSGSISGGSYGMFRQHVQVNQASKKVSWNFGEAFQRSDGYRRQSAMKRLNLIGSGKLRYGSSNNLKLTMLFSDLHYETPGGLTRQQFNEDPHQARPDAVPQKTGIYNTSLFGGLTNDLTIAKNLKHVISVFGTLTDYKNPFITNYEVRDEKNAGVRTYFEYTLAKPAVELKFYAGAEAQKGWQEIANYSNNAGSKGALVVADTIEVSQAFYFSRITLNVHDRFVLEVGSSINQFAFDSESINQQKPSAVWMPRLAMSYKFTDDLAIRASVSRGYSPPTIAEIRSDFGIYPALRAEIGWNTEAGFRFSTFNSRIQFDASTFHFALRDAIVRGVAGNDAPYFLNAGSVNQTGVELMLFGGLIPQKASGFIQGMSLRVNYTYSHFRFKDYVDYESDYSGNRLTGVPESNLATSLNISFPQQISFFLQAITTSRIPLNDANSSYADHYELLQSRIGWTGLRQKNIILEFFVGADNLLNQHYSLGNDINAFSGRYFNAAALRNFYGGINVTLP